MRALSDRRGHFRKDYLSCVSISRRYTDIAGITKSRERVIVMPDEECWNLCRVRKVQALWSMRKSAFGC